MTTQPLKKSLVTHLMSNNNKIRKTAGGHNPPLRYVMPTTTNDPMQVQGMIIIVSYISYNPNSKNLPNSRLEEIKIELDWISALKKQVDFLNSEENLPDFEIIFDVRLRRLSTS